MFDPNHQIIIQIILTVFPIIFGLYIVYRRSNSENLRTNFDRFFDIALLSIIIGRIVWIVTNSSFFLGTTWNVSPFIKIENFETLESYRVWFTQLPWKYLNIFDGSVSILGIPISLALISFLRSSMQQRIKALNASLPSAFLLFISASIIEYISNTIGIGYLFTNGNLYVFLLSLLIFAGLLILKNKLLKKQNSFSKFIRNENNDIVHEIASQGRAASGDDITMLTLNKTFLAELGKRISTIKRFNVPTRIRR